jgi:hypothetical protein
MDGPSRVVAGLVRISARLLPADQREWSEAARAEATAMPAGPARIRWLAGVLWLAVVPAARTIGWILFVLACGLGAVRLGWHSGSVNPATRIGRVHLITTTAVLVVLPWLVRPRLLLGPAGRSRAARTVRAGGYAVLCALPLAVVAVTNFGGARFETCGGCGPADEAQWHAQRVTDAMTGFVLLLGLMTAYAVGILWLTSRRSPATPATLTIGGTAAAVGGAAVYALMPVGGPLPAPAVVQELAVLAVVAVIPVVPAVAGYLAARRTRAPATGRARRTQGETAGFLAGIVGALLLTVLTLPTMALFPNSVALKWANPDPDVPHGTTYERQMSVGDSAGKYVLFLLLGPLVGAGMGLVGAAVAVTVTDPAATDPAADDPAAAGVTPVRGV